MRRAGFWFFFMVLITSCHNGFYKRQYKPGVYIPFRSGNFTENGSYNQGLHTPDKHEGVDVFASGNNEFISKTIALRDTNVNKKKIEYPSKVEPDYYPSNRNGKPTKPSSESETASSKSNEFYINRDAAEIALLISVLGCLIPVIPSIFAIFIARRALRDINKNSDLESNRGTAQIAIVIGIVLLSIYVLFIGLIILSIFLI